MTSIYMMKLFEW